MRLKKLSRIWFLEVVFIANPAVVAAALALARKKKTWVIIGSVFVVLLLLPLILLTFVGGLFSTLVGFLNPVAVGGQDQDVHYLALQAVSAEYHPENDLDVYLVKVIDLFHHDKITEEQKEVQKFIEAWFLLRLEREVEVTEIISGETVTHTIIEIYYRYKSFYEIVSTVRAAPFSFGDGAISAIVNLSMSGIGEIGKPPETPGDGTAPAPPENTLKGRYPAPIANGVITTAYGNRIHPITGKAEFHPALDIQGARFSPIMTIADGEVVTVNMANSPYGNYIIIKHELPEETFYTMYGHLSKVNVSVGQKVTQSQTIGIEGGNPTDPNPGWSTGHHLHFEIRASLAQDSHMDPADYIY